MADYGQQLQFGVFITPVADEAARVVELARLADLVGLELVTFQDHPYQRRFLDMWTLLSVVAAQTTNVRLAPNVANLPLRPPFMLARAVATLDVLSRGRVELGLGAGAFWDGIVAAGGPRLTPGQAVDALVEGIDVIRKAWERNVPAHDVEIWLGAYKKRMLALTGAKADGWLPSMGYAPPEALPAMSARIDAAAVDSGRDPAEIRRLYNINADGFTVESLAELALETGISTFILSVDDEGELRRFAEETAPAVRELVDAGRGRPAPSAEPRPAATTTAAPFAVEPTADDGTRLSDEAPWDESTRPAGPAPDPEKRYTADEQAAGRHLVDVHDALRAELAQLRDLIRQVAQGTLDAGAARSFIHEMTIRQNNWTLGAFCEQYCRVVTGHHTLEDRGMFPHLRRRDARLEPVLDRLGEEHHVIADVLDRVDRALVALVTEPDGIVKVQAAVDLLTDAMLSHLSYEERELVEPLARLGFS